MYPICYQVLLLITFCVQQLTSCNSTRAARLNSPLIKSSASLVDIHCECKRRRGFGVFPFVGGRCRHHRNNRRGNIRFDSVRHQTGITLRRAQLALGGAYMEPILRHNLLGKKIPVCNNQNKNQQHSSFNKQTQSYKTWSRCSRCIGDKGRRDKTGNANVTHAL